LTRSKTLLTLAAATLASLIPTASANAALIETSACDAATLTQPFAPFGDDAQYKLLPGGDLEGSLDGWTLSGKAKRVAGSSPFAATGEAGAYSLSIPAGSSVTTSASCVNAAYPSFRFFTRSSGGLLGLVPLLKVDLVYRDNVLGLVALPAGVVSATKGWTPSPVMWTLAAVGGAVSDGESPLAYRFTSVLGTWQVDDVFVDPHMR
jgi:hypothetical protein